MEIIRSTGAVLLLVLAGMGCRSTDSAKAKPVAESAKPPERIGQIRIEGNTITQNRVILNQLDFKVGDAVDSAKVAKAQNDLARLGIFDGENPPTVTVGETNPTTGFKTIVVRVKETRTGQIELHTGPNSNAGIIR